ncbi:MAG: L-alanine-DL-glutamate epimerase-like enolase superfamily enzyme [Verrucomicrobiales bacterium]|jgi:L-alanine-DL-glutamate epimerase-like enolase superfamily enzyme
MNLTWKKVRLELKHPWTLARGTSDFKEYWFVELEEDGLIGFGEAAHNVRYGESLESVEEYFINGAVGVGPAAARAAVDVARHDLAGKKLGKPVFQLLGIDARELAPTSYSIGIDSLEMVKSKIAESGEFKILKIKLGGDNDEEVMQAVREVTDKVVRIDANEGWKDREFALRRIEWLADLDVEFVEQPMPAGNLEDLVWLKERSPLPLVADEDACSLGDLPGLADAYDGINVKLMKAGGIAPAHEMILAARELGLKVMLGCMIESSLGISAAVHLAPLAEWIDLDGHLLVRDDPFGGLACVGGRLVLPTGAGLGVIPMA